MKNLILSIILFSIVLSLSPIFADDLIFIDKINGEIEALYGVANFYPKETDNGLVNSEVLSKYNIIVYGKPHGSIQNFNGQREPRFLGYNINGEGVPNPKYLYDSNTKKNIVDIEFIESPWQNHEVKSKYHSSDIVRNQIDDYTQSLEHSIIESLDDTFTDDKYGFDKFDKNRANDVPWFKYVHVVTPPTDSTRGSAVFFHKSAGSIYYIDISLRPLGKQSAAPLTDPNKFSLSSVTDLIDDAPADAAGTTHSSAAQAIVAQPFERVERAAALAEPTGLGGEIVLRSHLFNVSRAIPTGESLDIIADIKKPLVFNYTMDHIYGRRNYDVKVIQPYTRRYFKAAQISYHQEPCSDSNGDGVFDTCPGHQQPAAYVTEEDNYVADYIVSRDYSYYALSQLYFYVLEKLQINNSKLTAYEAMQLTLDDGYLKEPSSSYTTHLSYTKAPTMLNSHGVYDEESETYIITLPSMALEGHLPAFDFSDLADKALSPIQVRNDRVMIGESVLSSDQWCDSATAAPQPVPQYTKTTLRRDNHPLVHAITNGSSPTSGELHYKLAGQYRYRELLANTRIGGNPLTIHTPVVNESAIADSSAFDQRPDIAEKPLAIPLDTVVKIEFSTSGQHIDAAGYGHRDYQKYTKLKRVKFPFDAYYGYTEDDVRQQKGSCRLVLKNSWAEIDLEAAAFYVKVPIWEKEGDYQVISQTIAKNSRSTAEQRRANLDLRYDAASFHKTVSLTGRLFDFVITGTADRRWHEMMHQADQYPIIFSAGHKNKDGQLSKKSIALGRAWPHTLPLMPGKNTAPGCQYDAVTLGYPVNFSIKSLGDYYHKKDTLALYTTFFHIAKDGSRQAVDLYYKDGRGKWLKIGSEADNYTYKTITAQMPAVNANQITMTARAIDGMGPVLYGGNTTSYHTGVFSEKRTGMSTVVALSEIQRTFIGKVDKMPSGLDPNRVLSAVQMWHGIYKLPSTTIAVPAGTDMRTFYKTGINPQIREGYIAVNFAIELYKSDQYDRAALCYETNHSNQWLVEGYDTNQSLAGDVIYYEINQRVAEDYLLK